MRLKSQPTLREKKRYIIFRVISDSRVDYNSAKDAVWASLLEWMGEKELAKANVWLIKNLWNFNEQGGMIRCHPKYVDSVKVGLALIHQIGDSKVIFQTLRVTGTIKKGKTVK